MIGQNMYNLYTLCFITKTEDIANVWVLKLAKKVTNLGARDGKLSFVAN